MPLCYNRGMNLPASPASPLSLSGLIDENNGVANDEEIVASFDSLLHAELVRGRLQASGIDARLEDANTVSMAGHLALAIGGVKVVVAKDDIEAARELISTPVALAADDDDLRPTAREKTPDDAARWCFRLAIAGVVFPVVGQIGSLAFALQAWSVRKDLTAAGRRDLFLAIGLDACVLGAILLAVA